MTGDYVLAADLGGTNLRVASIGRDASILDQRRASTPASSASEIVDAIVHEAEAAISGRATRPRAFALAAAALVDASSSGVISSPNLPVLNGMNLADILSKRLSIPVILENDANAAAIGEHWLGAGKGADNFICITLGTGVGGGLIFGGRPYRGSGGTAGEIGHLNVLPDGVPCGCGSNGCIEQYASATAIARIARELLEKSQASSLDRGGELSALDVYEAGTKGDRVALETFRIVGQYLGLALADLIDLLNPDVIAIGGGAAGAWDLFIPHLEAEVRRRAFKHPSDLVRIVRAELGDEAGILGAAKVAIDRASQN